MQKKFLFLLLWQSCFLAAFSQVSTNEPALSRMASEIGNAQKKNYALAFQLAKQKGWPLVVNGKNGRLIKLTGVDAFGNPIYVSTFNNTIAAATTRTNQLWPGGSSGLNLSGSSDAVKGKLGIWDGGSPLTTHVELTGRVVSKDGTDVSDHATHTSGTMIASGVNPVAKGMAYGAQQLLSYDFDNDASEMAKEASNLLLSNHSYGNLAGWNYDGTDWNWYGDTTISRESYYFGYYSPSAQLYDSIAYHAPGYLICFGSGNSRNDEGPNVGDTYQYNGGTTVTRVNLKNNPDYGSVALNATAKNVLLVGAVNGLASGYSASSDVTLADFSSAGPTDDGRIKPDLVADGVNVTSSSSASNTAYESLSGTSMACPNTTGSLYLLQEYYNRLHPGSFMRAATLKALALHTADEAGTTGPDYRFGWGLLNSLKAANVITSSYNHVSDTLIEKTLDNGTNATYSVNVTASGNGKLYATIVWNDPPGTVNTNRSTILNNPSPKLVHDLDLRIVKQSDGTTFLPWVLTPSSPSTAAKRGDNTLDNVEQVVVDGAVPGQVYTIQVTHKSTLARSTQPFSLAISGIGGKVYCTSAATSTAGTRIDNVTFAGISNTTSAGCTKYNNFTDLTAQLEPNKTFPITIKLSSCDATNFSRVVKVYIDYNSNGVFDETSELVASGTTAGGTQTFSANVTTPSLTVGNTGLMRIVVQETNNASSVTACNAYNNGETQDYSATFISPTNDVSLPSVSMPLSNACASSSQLVQLTIRNSGKNAKSGVQITAVVKSRSTTVATLTGTYPAPILPSTTVPYTLQTSFSSLPSTTYTITAYLTGNASDQNLFNDTVSTTVTTAPKPATPSGLAEICGSSALLRATNPTAANYIWYAATPLTAPIATGSSASSTNLSSSYYLQTGIRGTLGLATKNGLGNGGYQIGGNYLTYTSKIPLVLESAKLFTRRAGQVTLYVADFDSDGNGTILTGTTFDVYPTNPNYQTVDAGVNDPADTGAIFPIGLSLPTGTHSIYVIASDTLLFRNSSLTANRYPFSIPNVISITSNSAARDQPTTFYNYYYYLYNMVVSTSDCISDAATIVPTTAPTPVVTQSGSNLVSSIATGNQWYFNNSPITGQTGSTYTPTQSGTYSVTVTDAVGCKRVSNNFAFSITALPTVPSTEINLRLLPNPTADKFVVKLHLNTPANLQFDLSNAHGQRVYTETFKNTTGDFSTTVDVPSLASGVYVLRITDGKKAYYEKVMIVK